MNAAIDILVVHDDTIEEEVLRALLSPDDELRIVGYLEGLGHHMPDADILVVACGAYSMDADARIREAVEDMPSRPVVLVTQGAPNGYVDAAFEAGAVDIVVLPQPCDLNLAHALSHQVRFTLSKVVAGRSGGGAASEGKMVVLIGPKGGTGKTLTASNLAVALAEPAAGGARRPRPAVRRRRARARPHARALDLRPGRRGRLARRGEARRVPRPHASGVRVLLAPVRPDQAGRSPPQFLRDLYPVLRERFDVVIVDTPPGFTPEVIATIDAATDICVVGTLDAPSLKNTRLGRRRWS